MIATVLKNLRLAALERDLDGILQKDTSRPTKLDYDTVTSIKEQLQGLNIRDLVGDEHATREIAVTLAADEMKRLKELFEYNGYKWWPE